MELKAKFVDPRWSYIAHTYSPATLEFMGTLSVQLAGFWAPSLIFTLLDLKLLGPVRAPWRKIQPLSKQPNYNTVRKSFLNCLQNQLLTSALHFMQLCLLPLYTSRTSVYKVEPTLPTVPCILKHIVLCALLREILFYYGHRLLHHPQLYRYVHKQHHEFTTPVALAAQYCHPAEHIISNIIPISLPPRLIGVHIVTFWLFLSGTLMQAVVAHSGYETPGIFGWRPTVHDIHHELFNVNYGLLGLWDVVHGTRYTGTKQKK